MAYAKLDWQKARLKSTRKKVEISRIIRRIFLKILGKLKITSSGKIFENCY